MVGIRVLVPLALILCTALAGCTSDDVPVDAPEAGGETPPESGAGSVDSVAHDLAFLAQPVQEAVSFEGTFAITEHDNPQNMVLRHAGMPAQNFQLHDITALVPADVPVRIHTELEHSAGTAGQGVIGTFVVANNPSIWVYEQPQRPDGPADILIVRAADEDVAVGVFYGSADLAPESSYKVDVTVVAEPTKLPAAIAYGVTLGEGDILGVEFDGAADPGAVWLWDPTDRFMGRFDAEEGRFHHLVGDREGGEYVLFVAEFNPDFALRVLRPEDSNAPPPPRVLTQVIENQEPLQPAGGTETTLSYDVPVVPLQVGYGYFFAEVAADPSFMYTGPAGTLDEHDMPGVHRAMGRFFNTDMGVPAQDPGTYTVTYSDTQNTDATLTAWYVTYGR